jgi:hypothetical protein
MNICCLHCGPEKAIQCSETHIIDHEVNQTLKRRYYKGARCYKLNTMEWWEVWVDGKILISPVSGFQWKAR